VSRDQLFGTDERVSRNLDYLAGSRVSLGTFFTWEK